MLSIIANNVICLVWILFSPSFFRLNFYKLGRKIEFFLNSKTLIGISKTPISTFFKKNTN